MATVHFYLNSAWSYDKIKESQRTNPDLFNQYQNTKLQIHCFLSTAGKRIKVYSGKRIEPIYWDTERERANTKIYKKHGVDLNEFLSDLETEVLRLGERNENNGKVTTIDEVRALIKPREVRNQVTNEAINFDDLFNKFIDEHKTSSGYSIRPNTLKKYKGFKHYIEEFSEAKGITVTLENINLELLSSFQSYLNSKGEKMSDSTKAKYIKAFKTFIKFYQKQEKIKIFDVSDIKAKETEGEIYVLSLEQLLRLQRIMFKSARLAKIRDAFCFMCWTGQRFSDYLTMTRKDLIEGEFGLSWKLVAKKITHGKLLNVPITPYAKEILDRYKEDALPIPTISNQKFNEALKEMGKKAKLDYMVSTVRYFNGEAKTDTVPFYQVLTSHVGRKTYITTSLMLGVPERIVREVSGHKDEKSFRRYVQFVEAFKTNSIQQSFDPANIKRVINQMKYNEPESHNRIVHAA